MQNKFHSTHLTYYKESEALQQLLEAIDEALNKQRQIDAEKSTTEHDLEFTINVAGVQTAFYLGGPQVEGLYDFVKHIAAENLYVVNIKNSTVKGW